MKKNYFLFTKILLSAFTFLIIWYLESKSNMGEADWLLPVASGIGFFLALNSKTNKYLILISGVSFIIMAILYLFWQISLASWFGSIGLLFILFFVLGNLKYLVKEGYVN